MRKLVVGITIASLMGCSMGHRDPVEVKQALNESINEANSRALEEIPSSVEADLMPNLDTNVTSEQGMLKRFRIQANAVEARNPTERFAVLPVPAPPQRLPVCRVVSSRKILFSAVVDAGDPILRE